MLAGSAVKLSMRGGMAKVTPPPPPVFTGVDPGPGCPCVTGGAPTVAFFVHPATTRDKPTTTKTTDRILFPLLSSELLSSNYFPLVYPLRPHRLQIISLGGQLLYTGSIRHHVVNLRDAALFPRKHEGH